jgi:predicted nucleotidyltransferase
MTQREALAILRAHADDIRRRGAQSLYLFGSTSRNAAAPESDVDVFVDPDYSRFTLLDWVDLETFLSDLLGRPVDLTTRKALRPELRREIEESATKVL